MDNTGKSFKVGLKKASFIFCYSLEPKEKFRDERDA